MAYQKAYSDGWKNSSAGGTPITAAALNTMENGVEKAVNYVDSTAPVLIRVVSFDPATGTLVTESGA